MKRKEAIERLRTQQENGDIEAAHLEADKIICQLLIYLGYNDVVEEYNKVKKWFA